MIASIFEIKGPVPEYMLLMANLCLSLERNQYFDFVSLSEAEVPTYLHAHASALVAEVYLDWFSHLFSPEKTGCESSRRPQWFPVRDQRGAQSRRAG